MKNYSKEMLDFAHQEVIIPDTDVKLRKIKE